MFVCTSSMWKFPAQRSNPHHNSNQSCCSENTGSSTCCTTKERPTLVVLNPWSFKTFFSTVYKFIKSKENNLSVILLFLYPLNKLLAPQSTLFNRLIYKLPTFFFFFPLFLAALGTYGISVPGVRSGPLLHPMGQLQQLRILNPLCQARDRTCAPELQRCHRSLCAIAGTPASKLFCIYSFKFLCKWYILHTML